MLRKGFGAAVGYSAGNWLIVIIGFWPFCVLAYRNIGWAVVANAVWILLLLLMADLMKLHYRNKKVKALEEARVRDLGLHSKPDVPEFRPGEAPWEQAPKGKHHFPEPMEPAEPYSAEDGYRTF